MIRRYFFPFQLYMEVETPMRRATSSHTPWGRTALSSSVDLAMGGSMTKLSFFCMPLMMLLTTFPGVSMGVNMGGFTPSNMPVEI